MKKILVRLPNWLGDIMMSFPFLYAMKEEFPDAEIAVIVKPTYDEVIKLLPFKVKIHHYDKKLHGTFPHEIHKYCVNEKLLFNIDIYFCLPPSFSSAMMGLGFRAKHRIGYNSEWRSWLFTHKFNKKPNIHRSQEYLDLLSLYLKKEIPFPKILSSEFPPYFNDEVPYVVINVNSEASSRRLPKEKWFELIDLFENHKFVFIGTEKEKSRVDEVIELLNPTKNTHINLAGKTSIHELCRLFAHAQGLVTNDSGPAHLASFIGTAVIVLFGAGDSSNTAPTYARAEAMVFENKVHCSPCLKNDCPLKTLECLNTLSMPALMDKMYESFHLK